MADREFSRHIYVDLKIYINSDLNSPFFQPVLLDDKGAEIGGGDANGALCLKTPWPGIARTVYGDHRRFVETYFAPYPGYYFTGDGGHRDSDGYFQGSRISLSTV